MAIAFEIIWAKLQKELRKGQVIRNWGNDRGFTGNTFEILEITENHAVCKPPKAVNIQIVPKDDFRDVWEIWPKYRSGDFPRHQIRDEITRFSSYIISIYKYLDI